VERRGRDDPILAIARTVWLEMIRRKDLYVALILLLALLMTLLSVNVYGLAMSALCEDLGLLLTMVFAWILSINSAGRQLPQEEPRARSIRCSPSDHAGGTAAWEMVGRVVHCRGCDRRLLRPGRERGAPARRGLQRPGLLQALALHLTSLGIICGIALALSTRTTYGAAAGWPSVQFAPTRWRRRWPFGCWKRRVSGRRPVFIYYALPHWIFSTCANASCMTGAPSLDDLRGHCHLWGFMDGC
jgi:hypothetical protein